MKLLRTILMTAGLVLFTQSVSAQGLSVVTLEAINSALQQERDCVQLRGVVGGQLAVYPQIEPCCPFAGFSCPVFGQQSWVNGLVRQGLTSWQRISTGQGRATAAACQACETIAGAPTVCATAPGCAKAGELVDAKKCCCAKACACCETCAAPKAVRNHVQPFPTCPGLPGVAFGPYGVPVPPMWVPMPHLAPEMRMGVPAQAASFPRVIAVPSGTRTQTPTATYQMIRSVPVTASAPQGQQAHLVTADFDIRCERMTHKGDLVMLEGNVRLVNLKLGRHMLVEAQRIMLNLRDGTFTVETDGRSQTTTGAFGVLRTSGVEPSRATGTVIAIPVHLESPR